MLDLIASDGRFAFDFDDDENEATETLKLCVSTPDPGSPGIWLNRVYVTADQLVDALRLAGLLPD